MMDRFCVWIRPLGSNCRVRVDGLRNAKWLLNRLGHSFVFKTAEAIEEDGTHCSFRVAYNSQTPRRAFEKLLAAIPEVQLMTDPA